MNESYVPKNKKRHTLRVILQEDLPFPNLEEPSSYCWDPHHHPQMLTVVADGRQSSAATERLDKTSGVVPN